MLINHIKDNKDNYNIEQNEKVQYWKEIALLIIMAVIALAIVFLLLKLTLIDNGKESESETLSLPEIQTEKQYIDNTDHPLLGFKVNTEEYYESLATKESDITGWSQLDKYNYGLDPKDGSDTDGDGISDKDEIDVYGTDPLLDSTAGDLYKDGYKLSHGMDLFTYYEYTGEYIYEHNKCSELTFNATAPRDFNVVADHALVTSSFIGVDDTYEVEAAYEIYNYEGTFSIDVSSLLSDYIKISDLVVYTANWYDIAQAYGTDVSLTLNRSNTNKIDTTYEGNNIYIERDEYSKDLVYIIGRKTGIIFD